MGMYMTEEEEKALRRIEENFVNLMGGVMSLDQEKEVAKKILEDMAKIEERINIRGIRLEDIKRYAEERS